MRQLLFGLLACASTASAATWTVDDDGPADFSSINDAIQAASDGDTIMVAAGYYTEGYAFNRTSGVIHIDRSVEVIGAGPGLTVVEQVAHTEQRAGAVSINTGAWHASIEGMTLINSTCGTSSSKWACTVLSESTDYNTASGSLELRHIVAKVPPSRAKVIHYRNNASLAVTFDHVTVDFGDGQAGENCYTNRSSAVSVFRNGIVINGTGTCSVYNGSALPFEYTVFDAPVAIVGPGNFIGTPTFIDRANGDYTPAPGSVAIDAGDPSETDPDGTVPDLGAYFTSQIGCPADHPEVERNGTPVCLHSGAVVDPTAVVGTRAVIGDGAFVAPRANIGAGVRVGAGSIIARRATLEVGVQLADGVTIGRSAHLFAGAQIGQGAVLGYASSVGAGSRVGDNAIIGNLVTIEPSVQFDGGVISRNSRVGEGTHLVGPNIIGPEVNIGLDVQGLGALTVRKNSLLGDNSVLGDGVRIGRDSDVQGVNVGADATLRADVCIGEDVPADTYVARATDTCTP